MSISGIEAVGSAVQATGYLPIGGDTIPQVANSGAFASVLSGAVENLQGKDNASKTLAMSAVTGDLADIHDYTIAATEAKVALELTAAIRNKAVDAFNEIMRMQA